MECALWCADAHGLARGLNGRLLYAEDSAHHIAHVAHLLRRQRWQKDRLQQQVLIVFTILRGVLQDQCAGCIQRHDEGVCDHLRCGQRLRPVQIVHIDADALRQHRAVKNGPDAIGCVDLPQQVLHVGAEVEAVPGCIGLQLNRAGQVNAGGTGLRTGLRTGQRIIEWRICCVGRVRPHIYGLQGCVRMWHATCHVLGNHLVFRVKLLCLRQQHGCTVWPPLQPRKIRVLHHPGHAMFASNGQCQGILRLAGIQLHCAQEGLFGGVSVIALQSARSCNVGIVGLVSMPGCWWSINDLCGAGGRV